MRVMNTDKEMMTRRTDASEVRSELRSAGQCGWNLSALMSGMGPRSPLWRRMAVELEVGNKRCCLCHDFPLDVAMAYLFDIEMLFVSRFPLGRRDGVSLLPEPPNPCVC